MAEIGIVGSTLVFPSGAIFDIVDEPRDDGIDYRDPVAGGLVPLMDIAGRFDERLSINFTVEEFASFQMKQEAGKCVPDRSKPAQYARISPELINSLQHLRTQLGAPLIVNSGYRHSVHNACVGGAGESLHVAGLAADIRSSGVEPLEIAEFVLQVIGCDIGIGLGKNIVHIDLRERLGVKPRASWVYKGAVMSEAEFDDWVRQHCE